MWLSTCPMYKKIKLLTKHSEWGNHKPPYIYLCRSCHNIVHGVKDKPKRKTQQGNTKNTPGTSRRKNK